MCEKKVFLSGILKRNMLLFCALVFSIEKSNIFSKKEFTKAKKCSIMLLTTVIGREVFKNGFCQRGACHRLKAAPRSQKTLCARESAGGK